MNVLERIKNFLVREDRNIVFGRPSAAEDTTLALSLGESDDAKLSFGDSASLKYLTLNIDVYASDYLHGYDLLAAVRNEITKAEKNIVKIFFKCYRESEYDAELGKHVLRSQYKIFE